MSDMNKIAVIGTVFMDIKGFAQNTYDPVGTNIGDIMFSFGGVGRNAAENLANDRILSKSLVFIYRRGIIKKE